MLGARGANNWCSKLRDSIAQKLVSRQKLLLRPCPSRLILIFQPLIHALKVASMHLRLDRGFRA